MGDSSGAEQHVRRILEFVDRGILSVDEAVTELYEDADAAAAYLADPDCARRFNDRMDLLIDACDHMEESYPAAGAVSAGARRSQTLWTEWHRRWVHRREVFRDFDGWDDPALAVEIVTRWCDDAMLDADDRFIEDAARTAGRRGVVPAVAAIVPLEDSRRYSIGAHHGSVTAIHMLRRLAADGSGEAQEHLRRLAAVAEWTTGELDG